MTYRIRFVVLSAVLLGAPLGCLAVEQSRQGVVVLSAGGQDRQCRSLEESLESSRKFGAGSGKTITLGAGKYFLDETLLLDERDEGLVIEATAGEEPELFGGRAITGWKKGDGDFWVADAPGTQSGQWSFRSLLVNGRYAKRARYPETGRLKHETEFKVPWLSTAAGGWERKPTKDELTRMVFSEGDLGEWLEPKNAELTIYHLWDETMVGAGSIDLEHNTLFCSTLSGHPIGSFGVRDYVVWNVEKGMTKPGQWYLDRVNGRVVYWPLPGENMETIEVVAPLLENVVRLENATNVTLRGLSIRSTNTPLMKGDFAAKLFDGAVSARDANGCTFERLDVSGATGWGLKLFGDNLAVKDCHIHDLGAGGLRLIGSHALIENNHIHHVGQTYPSAIVLYVGCTDPNMVDEWEFGKDETHAVIRHNELHDGPYGGIGIGGSHHVVEYNKVHHVMQDLADGAGLYATFCDNLTLRNNLVRDLSEGEYSKVSAYYLDEHCDKVLVENNISINVLKPSHNHMAKNNLYRNNIFISQGPMVITLPRCDSHTFERNVFVSETSVRFAHQDGITLKENVFDTPKVQESLYSREYRQDAPIPLALPGGNQITSAGLVFDGDDISFKKGSAPEKTGIRPIKGSEAGLRTARKRRHPL